MRPPSANLQSPAFHIPRFVFPISHPVSSFIVHRSAPGVGKIMSICGKV